MEQEKKLDAAPEPEGEVDEADIEDEGQLLD
jgi:hypothetical protein